MASTPIRVLAALAVATLAGAAPAQAVPTRAALLSVLGPNHTLEDFEALTFAWPFTVARPAGNPLDHTSVLQGDGPGLVAFGASYGTNTPGLNWAPAALGLLQSKALIGQFGATPSVTVNYAVPVAAAGLDVVWPSLTPLPFSASAIFRDATGAVLGGVSVPTNGSQPGQRHFVGWQHAAGISSIVVTSSDVFTTPGIDDHAYGIDPSQVAAVTTIGEGCYRRFGSFYEEHAAFDLSNSSLHFAFTGSAYVVTTGTTVVGPITGNPVSFQSSDFATLPLGWTLPYPGGTTTSLQACVHGFVRFASHIIAEPFVETLLGSGPILMAKGVYQGSWGGSIVFDTDPVMGTATLTFDQVPELVPLARNTFQFVFDSGGDVEVRFGSCATTYAVTGWSPTVVSGDPGSIDISSAGVITPEPRDVLPLSLEASARPVLGTTIALRLANVPIGSVFAAHVLGFQPILPAQNLTTVGMPDCFQHFSPDAFVLTVSPSSTVALPFAIPNHPSFAGILLGAQGAVLDPGGGHNAIDALTSNGVELWTGRF